MKVRIIELEGTPEELAESPYLRDLASKPITGPEDGPPGMPAEQGPLSDYPEVVDALDQRAPRGEPRRLLERFLAEVLSWGDVEPRRGKSTKTEDAKTRYIRLHRRGSAQGAFVYLYPARVSMRLRLQHEEISGAKFAGKRKVDRTGETPNPYQVRLDLRSDDAVEEAIALARKAYEQALA